MVEEGKTMELESIPMAKEQTNKWYEQISYNDVKVFIHSNIKAASRSFIAIGYYLKYVRDNRLYEEDGRASIWDFAREEYGISKSTASRYMTMNDRFSKDGNSPIVAEEYKEFGKSQLQEMLYLTNEQLEEVTPSTQIKQIRELRQPAKEIPYFEIPGQMDISDFPSVIPDHAIETHAAQAGSWTISLEDFSDKPTIAVSQQLESESYEEAEVNADRCEQIVELEQEEKDCIENEAKELTEQEENQDIERIGNVPVFSVDNSRTMAGAYGWERAIIIKTYLSEIHERGCFAAKEPLPVIGFQALNNNYQAKYDGYCYVSFRKEGTGIFMFVELDRLKEEYNSLYSKKIKKIPTYDEELLKHLIYGAARELELSGEMWMEKQPMLYTKHNMMLEAYKTLLEIRNQENTLLEDEKTVEKSKQPELPLLKNNEARAAFVDAYETWPLWIETEQTGERYYRYDLPDDTSMVVKVYHSRLFEVTRTDLPWEERYTVGYGQHEYYLLREGKFFRDCETNRTTLVDKLKELQKKEKKADE